MPEFPTLNPPVRVLMGPGPSDIHPRVLQALGKGTVGHLDPYYLELMNGMQEMLRRLFRTKNQMTMAISGTGSAGMEATVVNLIEPGDSMLVCVNGVFGGRMVDVAERAGAKVTKVERPWGEVFTPDDLQAALATREAEGRRHRDGRNLDRRLAADRRDFQARSRRRGAAAGRRRDGARRRAGRSRRLEDRRHLLRHAKVPELPAGPVAGVVQPAGDGRRFWPARRRCKAGISTSRCSPTTGARTASITTPAPINMTYGLYEALRLDSRGRAGRLLRPAPAEPPAPQGRPGGDRHRLRRAGRASTAAAQRRHDSRGRRRRRGPQRRCSTASASKSAAGSGAFKGKVWRIGLMGYGSRPANVLLFLSALEQLLAEQRCKFTAGASVAAANESYAKGA